MFCLQFFRPALPTTASLLVAICMISLAGCSQNPYWAAPGGAAWNMPQNAAISQNDARLAELNRRVQLLDDNNRQLHTQLAQSDQQIQVYKDESDLLRNQLAAVTTQMESTAIAARDAQSQVRGMQASTQIRGGAVIQPNTNLTQMASRLNLGGIPVQQDGEVIRVAVPSDQLFAPGTAQLTPQAASTLDPIATQLARAFPRNRIGIEGYTDNAPIYGGGYASTHQLTAAQASAVLDVLSRRNGMPPNQLFTVAQGSNNPRQSNETPAGRAANRRVELVIYPDNY
ncbi:putative lipoprotein YiaD precursor [Rubripirellula tenax]|uniref:Putative lipoprotein YiaD n=1 Tax=Rubripirellula tenax TaxID=2528015 RepID=A0A5C6FFT6_9BACT|nr:OmpA family protein [Rubripirellula tenax]TWU60381.1 putative lipoprotein YiaD precursor [Rubripirellula tenax]